MVFEKAASILDFLFKNKEMREKFKVRSPNCADAVMMSERIRGIIKQIDVSKIATTRVSHW